MNEYRVIDEVCRRLWNVVGKETDPHITLHQCFFLVPGYVFRHLIKRLLLGRKLHIKVSFMCPWLPAGLLMTQWAHAVIRGPLVSWAPGRLGAPGSRGPVRIGAPDRLGIPSRVGVPRVTWSPFQSRWPVPGRDYGYVAGMALTVSL